MCVRVLMTWQKWAPNNLLSNLYIYALARTHARTAHKMNIEIGKNKHSNTIESHSSKHHLQSSIYSLFHSINLRLLFYSRFVRRSLSFLLLGCNCKIKLSLIHFTIHWCVIVTIVVVVHYWNEWMSERKCGDDDCLCFKMGRFKVVQCTLLPPLFFLY